MPFTAPAYKGSVGLALEFDHNGVWVRAQMFSVTKGKSTWWNSDFMVARKGEDHAIVWKAFEAIRTRPATDLEAAHAEHVKKILKVLG